MSSTDISTPVATRLLISGLVQGIGLRPAIARLAAKFSLNGFVENRANGVVVHVEGSKVDVDRFLQTIPAELPGSDQITKCEKSVAAWMGHTAFTVRDFSDPLLETPGWNPIVPLATSVPTDRTVCPDCLTEIQKTDDRRANYAFTSCTNCGPRFSIIQKMPYERRDTSLESFRLCDDCLTENLSPVNRRFHCQTNACPACGPSLWVRNGDNEILGREDSSLDLVGQALANGQIIALRGIGGYQLLVDATNQNAVERLRTRKHRYGKPLAIMVPALKAAESYAELAELEKQLLQSTSGPIVVVDRRSNTALAESVYGGLNTIGIMLPTSPLHWLILNSFRDPLVCTSGNRNGEPLVYQQDEAITQLGGIADLWLEHDRPIERPIDDSVVRVVNGSCMTMRLGRGLAPLSLSLKSKVHIQALGAHQKASVAFSNGKQSILGPFLGDLNSVSTRNRYVEERKKLTDLFGATPQHFVCDQHPEYFSTTLAIQLNNGQAPWQVQHHHAHIVAGMLDNQWLDRKVIGVAFDGTGYGPDETIWGGEFLVTTAGEYQRVGRLRPFGIVGYEQSARRPKQIALPLVIDSLKNHDSLDDQNQQLPLDELAATLGAGKAELELFTKALNRPSFKQTTSSVGRLFDGVSALILGLEECDFEGQAAMLLESACDREESGTYQFNIDESELAELDWRPVILDIMRDRQEMVAAGSMAMKFHRALAQAVVQMVQRHANLPVILSGGVFQNRILFELVAEGLRERGQQLGELGTIPLNDGGLAAGQLAVVTSRLQQRTEACV